MAFEITASQEADIERMMEVWESSVRSTHDFLGEPDIQFLVPYVRNGLSILAPLYCLRDTSGAVYAFIGVAQQKIEMLFIHPAYRGKGAGRALVEFAVHDLQATMVDANEQNEQAVGFYKHLGFQIVGRAEKDPFDKPFPMLHMQLVRQPLKASRF